MKMNPKSVEMSYEELEKIADKIEYHQITSYPLQVINRNGVNEMIVYLKFIDDEGFCVVDRLEESKNIIPRGNAISLIHQFPRPVRYVASE